MSRLRSIAALRHRAAYWALLLALALGPVGLGAALDTLSPASCSDACDCDAIHAAHAATDTATGATAAADDDCGGECPSDCPDCACCRGLAPSLHPAPRIDFAALPSLPAPRLTAASPAAAELPDFFRPPRRLS